MTTIKKIGEISVDAGVVWIGDPCYVFHQEKPPKAIGNSWSEFCDIIFNNGFEDSMQFNYDGGHPGLGVLVSSGYGDGVYDVMAEIENGTVRRVWIDFVPEDEEGLGYKDG